MKKRLIILTIILVLSFGKNHGIKSLETESPDLMFAFQNTEANFQDTAIHIELKSEVEVALLQRILNLEDEPYNEENNSVQYNLHNKRIEINKDTKECTNTQSIDINLNQNKDLNYYRQIQQQLKEANIRAEYFVMITGVYDEKINESQMKTITSKILANLGAKFVEGGLIRDSFLSTSAYTPQISKHITTGSNKININIALKYNPSEGKTKLILASPLIYGDY